MKSIETKYFVFYKNGNYVEKNALSSLSYLNDYNFIIKKELHHEHTTHYNNTYHWFKYTSVDKEGNEKNIIQENFECIDLGFEKGYSTFGGQMCKILDIKRKIVHDLEIKQHGIEFLTRELIPALVKLNELGNWNCFFVQKENEKLLKENAKLLNTIINLEQNISDLESKKPL